MKQRPIQLIFGLLLASSLSGCAAWWQQNAPAESTQYAYLENFINEDLAHEMLASEPLQSQVNGLLKGHVGQFAIARERLLTITQIMQGYILSEGQSNDGLQHSLLMVDPERGALMIALVNVSTHQIEILSKVPAGLPPEIGAEMEEYAQQWSHGQLSEAQ